MFLLRQFFTFNEQSKACGIRRFTPGNYIKAEGQSTGTRHGDVLSNHVLVGEAIKVEDQLSCLEACKMDEKCQSCTFNDENSANPRICVLNYGPIERTLPLGANSGISSAKKDC